jgi:hypothetical protein
MARHAESALTNQLPVLSLKVSIVGNPPKLGAGIEKDPVDVIRGCGLHKGITHPVFREQTETLSTALCVHETQ